MLADLEAVLAAADPETAGVLWRLAENPRGLDANLVRLRPGAVIADHTDPVLDVLLIVLEGGGVLDTPDGRSAVGARSVLWLPRHARRSLGAGPAGMLYVTAHVRRPGLAITAAPGTAGTGGADSSDSAAGTVSTAGDEGGEAPCLLDLVCEDCGRVAAERGALYCSRCGARLPH
ncbi:hypothetical protein ABZY31_28680 [Streptomyces sp. NPDC006529]|uniref:cupin domain-containing protein n=1 Tax=Streptomyces sp. NPDC006529 TaxID=3157177 RepID=UPI00339FA551